MQTMTTVMPKALAADRKWFLVDAERQVLGRLATRVATILRGKHKVDFAPHLDVGDHVVVVNAEKVHLTGRKMTDKRYRWHTGYIGGLRDVSAERMLKTHPERVVEWAVQGMLPKGRLGRAMFKKLKVYRGPAHPHAAQKPEPLASRAPRAQPQRSQ
jgi:large subunit ribosomal protein L13